MRVGGTDGMSAKVTMPQRAQRIAEDKPPRAPKPPKPEKAPREPKPIKEPKPAKLPKAQKAPKAPKMPKVPKAPKAPKEKRERKPLDMAKVKLFGFIGGGAILLAALIVCGVIFIPKIFSGGPVTRDIEVPNLVGSVYFEDSTYADGILVPADDVIYMHDDNVEAGRVILQSPAPGVVIQDAENVKITLTVSLGPEMQDFLIPVEHRASLDDVKMYLIENYSYVSVISERAAAAPVADTPSGTVWGAKLLTASGEVDLSIDDGQIYKNKGEKIVLLYQP